MNFYELLFNRGQPSGEGMTHFERLFAAKLVGGGEIKELEGVPPLLFKANGEPLIDWSIYGNTVQNGTPTPTPPIQPQGTGERTGNLFDEVYPSISSTAVYKPVYVGSGEFTLSSTIQKENDVALLFFLAGNVSTGIGTNTNGVWEGQNRTVTAVDGYVTIAYRKYNTSPENSNTMLNSGSTALPYEPYGYKIPISSANTTTPVYLGEVETTRQIKKYEFTGQETFSRTISSTETDTSVYSIRYDAIGMEDIIDYDQPMPYITYPFFFCSHFVMKTNTSFGTPYTAIKNGEIGANSVANNTYNRYIIFASNQYNTVDTFQAFLAQQYANGTPVCVWYVLATEETGIVNEPLMKIGDYADSVTATQAGVEIPTIKGNNTLDIDTSVKPSNVYIKYKT